MPGDERQRHHLRRQGVKEVLAERRGDLLRLVFGQAFLQQVQRPLPQWFGEEHQPQRGGEGELEAHVPGQIRVEQAHERGGERQRVEPGLPAPNEVTAKGADRHHRRTHHRSAASHEDRVQGDEQRGKRRRPVAVEQAIEDPHEEESQHRHVEPRNGDDVRRAGLLVGFLLAGGQVLIQPQQDAGEQPGLGLGVLREQRRPDLLAQLLKPAAEPGAALYAHQFDRPRVIHHRGDVLTLEVIFIGKSRCISGGKRLSAEA